jgi:hypothetical protein
LIDCPTLLGNELGESLLHGAVVRQQQRKRTHRVADLSYPAGTVAFKPQRRMNVVFSNQLTADKKGLDMLVHVPADL